MSRTLGAEIEHFRLIRRLAVRDARLAPDSRGGFFLELNGRQETTQDVGAEAVEALVGRGLVVERSGGFVLSDVGRALLRRTLAAIDGYAAQHQDREAVTVVDDNRVLRQVTVNRSESPLSWLRHRRGRDGRPMIDAVEFAAGERLRSDYERGRMMPRVTANWTAAVAGHRRDGGAGGMADLTAAAIGARRRVERAVVAVGPELAGLLLDFCCFLKGLEDIERERRWPARSAKVILRLGLSALARHYGLAAKARGPARTRPILHWGTEDYRPALE